MLFVYFTCLSHYFSFSPSSFPLSFFSVLPTLLIWWELKEQQLFIFLSANTGNFLKLLDLNVHMNHLGGLEMKCRF